MPELLGLPYSPWSEKAKWALDARKIAFEDRVYSPLLGELALRLKLGKWFGNVSVPVLTDDTGRAIPDSTAIARWADAHGEGPSLFPPGEESVVQRYVDLSEEGLDAGRTLFLKRILDQPDALREMVPRGLRAVLGPLAVAVGRFGIWRTLQKYRRRGLDPASQERRLVEILEEMRRTIAEGASSGEGPKTLLGRFSFADIAMTQVLAFVDPPTVSLRIGKASRRSFTHDELRERYADVVRWRDEIYAAFRFRS